MKLTLKLIFYTVATAVVTESGRFSELTAQEPEEPKIFGVIIGDNVRARREPGLKPESIQTLLFRGNVVEVVKTVKGEAVKGDDTWYLINMNYYSYLGGTHYVHSSLVLVGQEARDYISQFDPEVHRERFQKYFRNISFDEVAECFHLFYKDNTAIGFLTLYLKIKKLVHHIDGNVISANAYPVDHYFSGRKDQYKYLVEIQNLTTALIPGLHYVSFSEEPQPQGDIDLYAMADMAARTPEKIDDKFIGLMTKGYGWGLKNRHPAWFTQTWDLGGYTNLGVGFIPTYMRSLDAYLDTHDFLNSEVKNIKSTIVSLLINFYTFGGPKKKCLAELETILKTVKFTEEQQRQIRKLIKIIKKEPGQFTFNCHNIECSYG